MLQAKQRRYAHGDSVDVGVVHEPNDLIREQLGVVLAVQVRLRGLRGVELKTLPNALAKNMAGRVRLHDFRHRLLNERFETREPVTIRGPEVVREVHANHDTGGGRVDTHGVRDLETLLDNVLN